MALLGNQRGMNVDRSIIQQVLLGKNDLMAVLGINDHNVVSFYPTLFIIHLMINNPILGKVFN